MCLRQASLIKAAVQDALVHLKRSRPFSLRNAFEERMGCLSVLSAAIAKSVVGSDNAVFQASACGIMCCKLEHLEVAVQVTDTFWLFFAMLRSVICGVCRSSLPLLCIVLDVICGSYIKDWLCSTTNGAAG